MSKRFIVYLALLLTIINLTILGVMIYHKWIVPETTQRLTGFELVKKAVGLTPDQVKQLQPLRQSFHADLDSLEMLLTGERHQLAQQIRAAEPDTVAMRRIINRIDQLQQESQQRIILHFMKFKAILKPEQQERFFDIVLRRFVSRGQFPMTARPCQDMGGR